MTYFTPGQIQIGRLGTVQNLLEACTDFSRRSPLLGANGSTRVPGRGSGERGASESEKGRGGGQCVHGGRRYNEHWGGETQKRQLL